MRQEECGFEAGTVLLSFLVGGLVGAGLALLMAPQSGPDTRKKIKDISGEMLDKAAEYADQAKHKTSTYYGQAKERVTATVDKAKDAFEGAKSALGVAVDAGREAYEKEVKNETSMR